MILGNSGSWWNSKIPTRRIAAICVALLVILIVTGWVLENLGAVIETLVWSARHRSTATYQELQVKVPWMWRQEETPAGQHQIRLVRARPWKMYSFESITISKDIKPQTQIMHRLEVLSASLGETRFKAEQFLLDPQIASQYSCVAPNLDKLPTLLVACDAMNGGWSIDLWSSDPTDRNDFVTILYNFSSARKLAPSPR
jgi:hypothetical protein